MVCNNSITNSGIQDDQHECVRKTFHEAKDSPFAFHPEYQVSHPIIRNDIRLTDQKIILAPCTCLDLHS